MAGLLNDIFGNADQTQAIGLLGLGLMNRNFAGGAQAAMQHMAGAKERELKQGLLSAQIAETLAQSKEREGNVAQKERQLKLQEQMLNGDGTGVSPGAFFPGGDGRGPTMPVGQAPVAGGLIAVAKQMGIPEHAIRADIAFNGGKGIAEMVFKRGTPDMKVSGGYAYDGNTVQPGFLPQFQFGQDGRGTVAIPGANGVPVVGAAPGSVETFGAFEDRKNASAAGTALEKVVGPDGSERFVPRSQVIAAAGGQPGQMPGQMPQSQRPQAPQTPMAQPGMNGNFRGDPAQVMEQIISIRDPQERANAMAAFQEQYKRQGANFGPMQATPTTAQAAAAAAAVSRAQAEGKGAGERTNTLADKGVKANDMLPLLNRAEDILRYGSPTASMIGSGVDKLGSLVGISSNSSQNASRLDSIAGTLTANVPRMEGPQSNFDVQQYAIQAGRVGDRTLPVADRLASLEEVKRIQGKYAHLNGGQTTQEQQPQRAAPSYDSLPSPGAYRGKVATDTKTGERYRSNGSTWVKERP